MSQMWHWSNQLNFRTSIGSLFDLDMFLRYIFQRRDACRIIFRGFRPKCRLHFILTDFHGPISLDKMPSKNFRSLAVSMSQLKIQKKKYGLHTSYVSELWQAWVTFARLVSDVLKDVNKGMKSPRNPYILLTIHLTKKHAW